ncbi:MAG: nitroreductase family protein [Oscillospiraceae bacterium]|nr:nitroreductase family protein [Oscillospiraceae bacterium]
MSGYTFENDPIFTRRSIRKFLKRDVPLSLIDAMINAAIQAPSAKNRQPWRFIMLAGEHKAEFERCMESGLDREENGAPLLPRSSSGLPDARNTLRIIKEAPLLIAVVNTNGKSPFVPVDSDDRVTEICDTLSIGAAVQNMLLTAEKLGLGTLWIANTCFAYPELTELLKTDGQLVGAVAVGYADEAPMPRPRKSIEEISEYRN